MGKLVQLGLPTPKRPRRQGEINALQFCKNQTSLGQLRKLPAETGLVWMSHPQAYSVLSIQSRYRQIIGSQNSEDCVFLQRADKRIREAGYQKGGRSTLESVDENE